MTRTSAGLRRRRATAGVLALTTVTGIALAPPSAGAPAPAGFVVPGYDVRVALANGRVFEAATDLADDSVHVFDLAGQQLAAIPGEPDVRALTASADGTRIYVALGTSQAVSVIDTASLTEIARYDVSAIGTPVQFAEAGDRLFVAGSRGPWDLGVGVVAISQPGSSATAIAGGSPPWARIAAYESSPGVSQLYVTGCSITGSCPLEHYTYTGGADAALQQRDYLSLPRGMALTADGSALLTSAGDDTVSVRNPDDLSITATIAGAYDGAWTSLVNERLVQVAYNKVGNSYDQVQVRDLTGALTYSYQAGRALIPLTGAGSSDVYAAVLGSDLAHRATGERTGHPRRADHTAGPDRDREARRHRRAQLGAGLAARTRRPDQLPVVPLERGGGTRHGNREVTVQGHDVHRHRPVDRNQVLLHRGGRWHRR